MACARQLLLAGADVDVKDLEGNTPSVRHVALHADGSAAVSHGRRTASRPQALAGKANPGRAAEARALLAQYAKK